MLHDYWQGFIFIILQKRMKQFLIFAFSLLVGSISFCKAQQVHTLLWKISGNGLRQSSYLFGTMHTIDGSVITKKYPVIESKIKSASTFLKETVPDGNGYLDENILYYPGDSTIKSVLSEREYSILTNYIKKQTSNNDEAFQNLIRMRPQLLTLAIEKIMGDPAKVSATESREELDEFLLKYAQQNNLQIAGLENATERSELLLQTTGKKKAIKNIFDKIQSGGREKTTENIDKDSLNYMDLKVDYHLDYKIKSTDSVNDEGGAIARNKLWLNKIVAAIKEKSCFIAVGSGHLKYSFGLIVLLRNLGYTVSPVKMN